MSQINTNAIVDASGGTTATVNGYTPTASNMAGRNRIINGDMRIDQRNAGANVSISSTPTFVTDRFQVRLGTGSGHVSARSTDAPTGFKNSLAVTVGTGGTPAAADGSNYVVHWIEGYNVADFGFGAVGASTITISFWVKSSLTGQFGASLANYGLTRSYPFTYTINSANTWEQKTVTITGDTTGSWSTDNSGWGGIIFDLGNGANYLGSSGAWAGADYRGATGDVKVVSTSGATFYITGVQLEEGSVATPFEHRQYGQELALCQRYYYTTGYQKRSFSTATGQYGNESIWWPVTMRATPSCTWTDKVSGGWSFSSFEFSNAGSDFGGNGSRIDFRSTGSSPSAYLYGTVTASAEL